MMSEKGGSPVCGFGLQAQLHNIYRHPAISPRFISLSHAKMKDLHKLCQTYEKIRVLPTVFKGSVKQTYEACSVWGFYEMLSLLESDFEGLYLEVHGSLYVGYK